MIYAGVRGQLSQGSSKCKEQHLSTSGLKNLQGVFNRKLSQGPVSSAFKPDAGDSDGQLKNETCAHPQTRNTDSVEVF